MVRVVLLPFGLLMASQATVPLLLFPKEEQAKHGMLGREAAAIEIPEGHTGTVANREG
jgi:hypothetical protein